MISRTGFGMIELIVALTILSIGLLGLAAAAAVAQRSFTGSHAVEQGADAAALVLDSLLREPAPVPGSRAIGRASVTWSVANDSAAAVIVLSVNVPNGAGSRQLTFRAVHAAR